MFPPQVNPDKYKSIGNGFAVTVREDGVRGLAKGWAPTFIGYSMQGLCKFGFYEVFKIFYSDLLGEVSTQTTTFLLHVTFFWDEATRPNQLLCTSDGEKRYMCPLPVLIMLFPPNRRTPTCGGHLCTSLPQLAQSSLLTSLWLPWRLPKFVSRPSQATPTPSESVPPRCLQRRGSGRKC